MRRELQDAELEINISFSLTSIFDHTIFDALSKVVQSLFPFVSHITNMLDHLITSCKIEKSFIFDLVSKIFIATDSSPVDIQHYEICSELIDVLIDVSCIYGDNSLRFDENLCTTIKLKSGETEDAGNVFLYLKEVDENLALVCMINEIEFQKKHLINYNINQIKVGLKDIFEAYKK
jgi:Ras-related GTP-binding protein C/D